MPSYPELVNIAWNVIYRFIEEWQVYPYRFEREIDIQVALTSRFDLAYKLLGKDTVCGKYNFAVEGLKDQRLIYNRVCCEPKIDYKDSKGNSCYCYPDIVVWDDIDNPDNPPYSSKGEHWPILWACEIKYDTDIDASDSFDLTKMNDLLKDDKVGYGFWLQLQRCHGIGDGIEWVAPDPDLKQKLWYCNVTLPEVEKYKKFRESYFGGFS